LYLEFPISSNISRRNLYFDNICDSIRQNCIIHRQRQLSFRGRATVLNTLIFSRLWHVLRFFIFPKLNSKL
ncbi:hypothetical protein EDC94DRAFT_524381, partial [Helicostylum pulchrum]